MVAVTNYVVPKVSLLKTRINNILYTRAYPIELSLQDFFPQHTFDTTVAQNTQNAEDMQNSQNEAKLGMRQRRASAATQRSVRTHRYNPYKILLHSIPFDSLSFQEQHSLYRQAEQNSSQTGYTCMYTLALSIACEGFTWHIAFSDDAWLFAHPVFAVSKGVHSAEKRADPTNTLTEGEPDILSEDPLPASNSLENEQCREYTDSTPVFYKNVLKNDAIILPDPFKAALLESFAEPFIAKFSHYADMEMRIVDSYLFSEQKTREENMQKLTQMWHSWKENCSIHKFKAILPFLEQNGEPKKTPLSKEMKNNTSYQFFMDFFIPTDAKFDLLLEKFLDLPLHAGAQALNLEHILPEQKYVLNIPVHLSFEAGYTSLCKADFENLACGDVLLPDALYVNDDKIRLLIGSSENPISALYTTDFQKDTPYCIDNQAYTFCSFREYKAILLQDLSFLPLPTSINQALFKNSSNTLNEEDMMTQKTDTNTQSQNMTSSENATKQTDEAGLDTVEFPVDMESFVANLETVISFELERRVLSVADLQTLKAGYTIALACDKHSPVTLRVNGKAMGTGKLVDMDGVLGVQITKLGA